MRAAGAYLRVMRESLSISQAEVARRIKAASSQIHRIEEGPGETRASLVAAMAIAVQAEPDDLVKLLADDNATEEIGRELAISRIEQRKREEKPGATVLVHPEIARLASKMSDFQLGKWVSMGERLLGE